MFLKYLFFFVALDRSLNNTIERRFFNGSSREMIKGNFGNIQSMAYDWIGNNLFYSSSTPKYKISVLKLNELSENNLVVRTLVSKNIIGPSSIALDVENGKLIFSKQKFRKIVEHSFFCQE